MEKWPSDSTGGCADLEKPRIPTVPDPVCQDRKAKKCKELRLSARHAYSEERRGTDLELSPARDARIQNKDWPWRCAFATEYITPYTPTEC